MLYVRPSMRLAFNPPRERKTSQQIHLLVAPPIKVVVAQPCPGYQREHSPARCYGQPHLQQNQLHRDKKSWERKQYGIALDPKADEKQASENLNGEARISAWGRRGALASKEPRGTWHDAKIKEGHRPCSTQSSKLLGRKNKKETSLQAIQVTLLRWIKPVFFLLPMRNPKPGEAVFLTL